MKLELLLQEIIMLTMNIRVMKEQNEKKMSYKPLPEIRA